MVRHVEPDRRRQTPTLLRLVQGATRLDHPGPHRPHGQAKADPLPDRGLAETVLQGACEAGRQRIFSPGKSQEKGLRPELARGGTIDLARRAEQADPGGIARHRRAERPARVLERGAVPESGEQRVHAVHDAAEPGPTRQRLARAHHEYSSLARWADYVLYRI